VRGVAGGDIPGGAGVGRKRRSPSVECTPLLAAHARAPVTATKGLCTMATDYDAPRRTESDDATVGLLDVLTKRRNDPAASVIDVDESPPGDLLVTTAAQHENGRAPRAATTRSVKTQPRRVAPDARGLFLATRWCAHPDAPAWARKNTATAWAGLLAGPARHGSTARDLNQLLDDHTATHGQLLAQPRRPIGYLFWLLHHTNRAERPCALDDARHDAEAADAARRNAAQAAAAVEHTADREAAQAALGGAGHTAAREGRA